MIILLNVKNDAYRRIFGAQACSRAEISFYQILKHVNGQTTLKNHFFPKIFSEVDCSFRGAYTQHFFTKKYPCILELSIKFYLQNISDSRSDDFRFGDISVYFESKCYCELSRIEIFWFRPRKFFETRISLKCVGKNIFFDLKFGISGKFRVE